MIIEYMCNTQMKLALKTLPAHSATPLLWKPFLSKLHNHELSDALIHLPPS